MFNRLRWDLDLQSSKQYPLIHNSNPTTRAMMMTKTCITKPGDARDSPPTSKYNFIVKSMPDYSRTMSKQTYYTNIMCYFIDGAFNKLGNQLHWNVACVQQAIYFSHRFSNMIMKHVQGPWLNCMYMCIPVPIEDYH